MRIIGSRNIKMMIFMGLCLTSFPPAGTLFAGSSVAKIAITAELTEFAANFPWSEHGVDYEADGVSPMGIFKVLEPQKYAGRNIKIIFKYEKAGRGKVSEKNVGDTYSFLIEEDFVTGNYVALEDVAVDRLKKLSRTISPATESKGAHNE